MCCTSLSLPEHHTRARCMRRNCTDRNGALAPAARSTPQPAAHLREYIPAQNRPRRRRGCCHLSRKRTTLAPPSAFAKRRAGTSRVSSLPRPLALTLQPVLDRNAPTNTHIAYAPYLLNPHSPLPQRGGRYGARSPARLCLKSLPPPLPPEAPPPRLPLP